jgi:hypothetical protein
MAHASLSTAARAAASGARKNMQTKKTRGGNRRSKLSQAATPSSRRRVTARVVQDPRSSGSIDFSGSIDMDYADDLRREIVERDTAETLRKTIAVRCHATSSRKLSLHFSFRCQSNSPVTYQ